MKQHLFAIACLTLALSSCGPVYVVHQDQPPQADPAPAPPEEVSYQSFYDQLSPYGQWIDDPSYGYVWMPNVGPEFKPYATNGHWVYTDEGWTWASEYPWGWAAFHYGRWFYQDGYGWMWIPGQEWAPAWVSWRNSSDYYGWAPLGPNVSIGISVGGGYNPPPHYWSFVPHQYVASPQVNNYYVNESRNTTIINNTTVINNTVINNNNRNSNNINNNTRINNRSYAGGPSPDDVGRFSGAPLRPVALRESNTPGERVNGGELAIYRPRINPATAPNANRGGGGTGNAYGGGNRPAVAPARTQPLNNVRPSNTMRYNNNGYNNPNNNNGTPAAGNGQPTGNGQPIGNGRPTGNGQPSGNTPQAPGNDHFQRNGQYQGNGSPAMPPATNNTGSNGTNGGNPRMRDGNPNGGNPNGQPGQFPQRTTQPVQPQVQNGRPAQSMPPAQDNAPAPQQGTFRPHGNQQNGSPANTSPVNMNPVNGNPAHGNPSTANPPNATAPPHINPSAGAPPMNTQQPRGFVRPIPNTQASKPVVKPAPQAHSAGDKPKDKEKDKEKKEQ